MAQCNRDVSCQKDRKYIQGISDPSGSGRAGMQTCTCDRERRNPSFCDVWVAQRGRLCVHIASGKCGAGARRDGGYPARGARYARTEAQAGLRRRGTMAAALPSRHRMLEWPKTPSRRDIMATDSKSRLSAVVQTAPQAGRYVWVIALVDFDARQIKRTIVSDDTFTTADAARDVGEAQLKAMAGDH